MNDGSKSKKAAIETLANISTADFIGTSDERSPKRQPVSSKTSQGGVVGKQLAHWHSAQTNGSFSQRDGEEH
jgi:hypothetical protein